MSNLKYIMTHAVFEDNMDKFKQCVNMYQDSGFVVPSGVEELTGDDFSRLVYKDKLDTFIDSIMTEDCKIGTYPLLGSNWSSRMMPNIHEHIGEGSMGHVYSTMTKAGPMAIKFQNHSDGSGPSFAPGNGSMNVLTNEFTKEVYYHLFMSSIGLAPRVYNSWTSPYCTIWGNGEQDVLVMDRLDETLYEKTLREGDFTREVMELISNMHENDVFHGDLHSGNIMISYDNNPLIIDFGKTKQLPRSTYERIWCMVHDYVLLYTTLPKKSELKPVIKKKIFDLSPSRTILGTTFDLCE